MELKVKEQRPFIIKIKPLGENFEIPTHGKFYYNYTAVLKDAEGKVVEIVKCADDDVTFNNLITNQEYTIEITGVFPYILFSYSNYQKDIIDIIQWGSIEWEDMCGAFQGCSNLKISATDIPNLSKVEDMSFMFYKCRLLNSDFSKWNVSKVEDMRCMFDGCTSLNTNFSNWDVSKVTDMSCMFDGCTSLNTNFSNWDVSKVTDMSCMFNECISLNTNFSNWDVSKVKDMSFMFYGCISLNTNFSNWDVSNVTNMSCMFDVCPIKEEFKPKF